MELTFNVTPTGIDEIEEKVLRAQNLLTELKLLLSEINESRITLTLTTKPS